MKEVTDQYHWDFDRLLQRAQLVLDSFYDAPHIDPERLEIAQSQFNEAFRTLLSAIEGA